MNKTLRYTILMLLTLVAGAMSMSAQLRYGATVGMSETDLKFRQKLITVDPVKGFGTGVTTEIMFPGIGFGLGTGLYYEMKGAKLHLGEKKIWYSDGYGTERSYLHYLEVPFNVRFKWTRMGGVEDYVAPLVYGGATLGVQVGHSHVHALKYSGADLGLEVGFGLEVFKRWQIVAVRNWGVTYALKTKLLDDFSAQNRSWSVKLIYYWK